MPMLEKKVKVKGLPRFITPFRFWLHFDVSLILHSPTEQTCPALFDD